MAPRSNKNSILEPITNKIYQIVLYGGPGAGKTTILTVLGMDRIANPLGYTCHRIPEPWKLGLVPPHHVDAYKEGETFLLENMKRMNGADVPKKNEGHIPYRFLFKFSATDRGAFYVELIDYSGELLGSKDDLANRLREHMNSADALLVLAEVPREGEEAAISAELYKLLQAFSELLGENPKLEMPVALLLNKWDRRKNPDAETTLHTQVRTTLRNSVTDFDFFKVSAFGEHVVESVKSRDGTIEEKEVAKYSSPFHSYGLEDGFVWAADRRDAIDLEHYQKEVASLRGWRIWQLLGARSSRRLAASGRKLVPRFLAGSDARAGATAARRIACNARNVNVLCLLAWIAVVWLAGETLWDRVQYNSAQVAFADPSASSADIARHLKWLEDYAVAPNYRHIVSRGTFLGREPAMAQLAELQEKYDTAIWESVVQARPDLEKQASLAKQYVQVCPNGKHLSDANTIIAKAEINRRLLGNENWLKEKAGDWAEKAAKGTTDQGAESVLKKIDDGPPYPELASNINDEKVKLRGEIVAWIIAYRQRQFVTNCEQRIKDGQVKEVAADLAGYPDHKSQIVNNLKERFGQLVFKRFQCDATTTHHSLQAWNDARNEIEALSKEKDVVDLISTTEIQAWIQACNSLLTWIDDSREYELFAEVKKLRNTPTCKTYLELCPRGRHYGTVDALRSTIEQREGQLNLTIKFASVYWDPKIKDGLSWDHDAAPATVIKDEKKDPPAIFQDQLVAVAGTNSGAVGEIHMKGFLKTQIKLEIQIGHKDSKNQDFGHAVWEGRVETLANLASSTTPGITLSAEKYDHKNIAYFTVVGIPSFPPLDDAKTNLPGPAPSLTPAPVAAK